MRKLRYLVAIVLLVTLIIAIPTNMALAEDAQNSETNPSDSMVDVLITFYQPPGPDGVGLVQSLGGTVKKVYHVVPTIWASIPSQNIQLLSQDPSVKVVEENAVRENCLLSEVLPWGVDRVDAEQVHPTNKGTGVKVAVLDTGIDLDHPDLAVAGNVTFIPGTSNGDDDNGHGTLVAGIIGALDNDIGVIGVAPEASLYSVKVLDYNGNTTASSVLSGIEWARDNNMKVINMSFGSIFEMSTAEKDALNNAYNAGIVLVAGAGNSGGPGNNIYAPARYTPVIAVGSTDEQNIRYSSSSTGYQLELMAPGVNIYSTAMGGGYGYVTTTSAASPHVAGTAALLINAGFTNNVEVRNRMKNSATDLGATGWDTEYGCGLVNAVAAINFSEPPDQTPPTTTISLSGTLGNFANRVQWYRSDVTVTISATDSGSGVAQTQYSTNAGATWNVYTGPVTLTTEMVEYIILARSWDNAGNDEGPPAFKERFKIDKTPPAVTESCNPTSVQRIGKGYIITVAYSGTASDSGSGLYTLPNQRLTDSYGVYTQDLGSMAYGSAGVEAWCTSSNRTYTFRYTVGDAAGNQAYAEAICTIYK